MTARQTIIATRGDQSYLSTQVAALVPSEIGRAAKAVLRSHKVRGSSQIKTTFCPVCGGDKGKDATRCKECQKAAMTRHREQGGSWRGGASRHAVSESIRQNDPERRSRVPMTPVPAWNRRVVGEGQDHRQLWRRMVLTEKGWVEQETPEAVEWKVSTKDALRRMADVRLPLR